MNIKYHSEAKKDFFQASEYYENQVAGLGDEFIKEVEKVEDTLIKVFAIMDLRRRPNYWQNRR